MSDVRVEDWLPDWCRCTTNRHRHLHRITNLIGTIQAPLYVPELSDSRGLWT